MIYLFTWLSFSQRLNYLRPHLFLNGWKQKVCISTITTTDLHKLSKILQEHTCSRTGQKKEC